MNIGFGLANWGLLFDFGFSVLPIFVFVFGVCRCPKLQSIIFILTHKMGVFAMGEMGNRPLPTGA